MNINATPGDAAANSYLTLAEAQDYFSSRVAIAAWDAAENQEALLIMATRMLDAMFSPQRIYVPDKPTPFFRLTQHWTGTAATATQALAWPRSGMLNRNGFEIAADVIPLDLKYATAELAGQLATGDRTLDNDVAVQGLTSVKAGSVSLSFKHTDIDITKVIPDAVTFLLVPSWLTEERIEWARGFEMTVY